MAMQRRPLRDRFEEKVDRLGGPIPPHRPELGRCHLWTGWLDANKRGYIGLGGRNAKEENASRVAFFLAEWRWPFPCALYHCDNPTCVRRSHLFEGTKRDNTIDMVKKGRHGLHVHPERAARGRKNGAYTRPDRRRKGEDHGRARLKASDVISIRKAYAEGETQRALSKRYGVAEPTIGNVVRHETWKEIR